MNIVIGDIQFMKQLVIHTDALKQMAAMPARERKQLVAKLQRYAATGAGNLERLTGRPESRLRQGDWRAIFVETGGTVTVLAVGNRRDIYK